MRGCSATSPHISFPGGDLEPRPPPGWFFPRIVVARLHKGYTIPLPSNGLNTLFSPLLLHGVTHKHKGSVNCSQHQAFFPITNGQGFNNQQRILCPPHIVRMEQISPVKFHKARPNCLVPPTTLGQQQPTSSELGSIQTTVPCSPCPDSTLARS